MEVKKFNDDVLEYRQTRIGLERLVYEISLYIYSILKYHYKMDDDERGDFFCDFYPKIPGLIGRFEYYGIPFDGYLNSSIRWNIKAFRASKSKYRSKQKAIQKAPFYLVTPENDFTQPKKEALKVVESARDPLRLGVNEEMLSDTIRQRLLYLFLLEAEHLDERVRDGIIRITGYDNKWLDTCLEKLKTKIERRQNHIKMIRNRRNSAFFTLHLLQEKYSFEENTSKKKELQEEISILRKKIIRMNAEISKAPSQPTHQDLADVLGIPRGSIDSGIYYIKTSFKEIEQISA